MSLCDTSTSRSRRSTPEVIYFNKTAPGPDDPEKIYGVEIALQYNDGYNENVYTFVNNINTSEGGTHLVGFKTALTRALNNYARSEKLLKAKESTTVRR